MPFNLNDTSRWFCYMHPSFWDNIGRLLVDMPYRHYKDFSKWQDDYIGYKVENGLLKLYYSSDGFFFFDTNRVILQMYLCNDTPVTDSNWYNCAIFEEIEQ